MLSSRFTNCLCSLARCRRVWNNVHQQNTLDLCIVAPFKLSKSWTFSKEAFRPNDILSLLVRSVTSMKPLWSEALLPISGMKSVPHSQQRRRGDAAFAAAALFPEKTPRRVTSRVATFRRVAEACSSSVCLMEAPSPREGKQEQLETLSKRGSLSWRP